MLVLERVTAVLAVGRDNFLLKGMVVMRLRLATSAVRLTLAEASIPIRVGHRSRSQNALHTTSPAIAINLLLRSDEDSFAANIDYTSPSPCCDTSGVNLHIVTYLTFAGKKFTLIILPDGTTGLECYGAHIHCHRPA